MRAARYIGKPETTQIGGGNWLSPGDVITEPAALVRALLADKNAFEEVDMSLPEPDVEPEDVEPTDDNEEDASQESDAEE